MGLPSRNYDVFLSYNTRDHQAVERVRRWLEAGGLTCFMDRWYLRPGASWLEALEQALLQSKAVVVFLGPGEMGRWQQRERDLALDRQASCGMPVIPVLLPGADPPLGFLGQNVWVDLRTGPDEEHPLKVLVGAVRGLAPAELETESQVVAQTVCPFRGLLPFREEDAPFFFGRQKSTDQLVTAITIHPFVAVLGASGSGKSSVVRAGLVPRLRSDRGTGWEVVTMVPTARPLNSLLDALSSLLWPDLEDDVDRRAKANETTAKLQTGSLSLRDLAEIALNKQPGTQGLLLVVDQWEELYALCRDDGLIRSFTDQLLDASRSAPLKVVFTCRADFYGRVLGYRPLVDRIGDGAQISLGPMDEGELEQVIDGPVAKMWLEFEPGLRARILGDVGQEPGRLPLLSFLLEQLWKQRRGAVLTNEAYDAMGGVEGSIATVAEAVFSGLPKRDQELLPRLFIQLVSVGEESEDTRRRALTTTLGEDARPLIATLAAARLLVSGSDQSTETVEVAHEALIRHWKRSRGWVDNARGFLTWRKRLEPFAEAWLTQSRDASALLRGGLLAEAQRWLSERRSDLDRSEREFIEASLAQQESVAQAELRRNRFLVGLSVTALAAACVAWWQWGVAKKNADIADQRKTLADQNAVAAVSNANLARTNEVKALGNLSASLAAHSAAVRDEFPQRSVLLALESMEICKRDAAVSVVPAEQSVRDSLQNLGGIGLCGHEDVVNAVVISPDGRWLVTGSDDNTARLWDLSAKEPGTSTRVLKEHKGAVYAVAISPGGRWLVTGSGDGTARLWDLNAKEPENTARVLRGHERFVSAVAISPDGRWLVTNSGDETARLWDLNATEPESTARVLKGHREGVSAVAISPSGRWLATGSNDSTARLWDLNAKEPETSARILKEENAVRAVAISPDERWLVTGGSGKTARLWDLNAKEPESTARVLTGHDAAVVAVAISPNGRWLVTGSPDKTARLWDLNAKEPENTARVLKGHEDYVRAVAIGPDGRWLVTGSGDKTARLWDLNAKEPGTRSRVMKGHDGGVSAVAISPDGRRLVTASRDGTARLWDLNAREPETSARVWKGHEDAVYHVAISPNGRWLVTGSPDKTARLWDLNAKEPENTARVLKGHKGAVCAVAISADGRWLVTGSWDHTARLWDLNAKEPESTFRVLEGHDSVVDAVAISPDGRWLVTGSYDTTARVWDLNAKEPETSVRVLKGHDATVVAAAISPDGRWLVTGSGDKTARLWDLRAKDPETSARVLSGHEYAVLAVAISPNGRWLVTGSFDKTARLWDLNAKEPENTARVLNGHEDAVYHVAISPNGRWLVTGSPDKTARLWDLNAKEPENTARVLKGHKGAVRAVAISADGRWLATGSGDNTARLWDLNSEEPENTARVLKAHEGAVNAVAISPDGRWLVTGSEDKTVRLWPLRIEELLKEAERAVGRNFTRKEWEELFPGEPYRKTVERFP